jgi:hypothetical protein
LPLNYILILSRFASRSRFAQLVILSSGKLYLEKSRSELV